MSKLLRDIGRDGINLESKGRLLKTVFIRDEWIVPSGDPKDLISEIRREKIPIDIFTFVQGLSDLRPHYPYYMEWDNVAAIRISTFEKWFKESIHQNARNKIRKAEKKGISVRVTPFNDDLVLGMMEIFNESQIRRGRRYTYYGQDFESVRKGWQQDLDSSEFLVAYFGEEMVGFIKLVYGKECVRTSGTISKLSHRDKSPMNALFSSAVERCAEKNYSFLIYGKFSYGKKEEDSLAKFKRYNGFEKIEVPRYFVPLSWVGRLALGAKLHHGLKGWLPGGFIEMMIRARAKWYSR